MRKRARKTSPAKLYVKGKRTRAAIVSQALRIASGEGLPALTIGRLASELKMSKSGLFAHFRSKEALELATVERASNVFADKVLFFAEGEYEGLEALWNLCDRWLEHIEKGVFRGGYFLTGVFFSCAQQRGPVPDRITETVQEWFEALKNAVQQAHKHWEIRLKVNPRRTAFDLNGLLLGAHWAHLMGDRGALEDARSAVLGHLHKLVTKEIPVEAFESVRAFRKYLRERHA
jgi:AcrR family transcriptional regulator